MPILNNNISVNKYVFEMISQKVKEAIHALTQKESLDTCDIQAICCLVDIFDINCNINETLTQNRTHRSED